MKRQIKIMTVLHCAMCVRYNGESVSEVEAGETLKLDWQPASGWGLLEAHYTDEDGNVVAIDLTTKEFTMPDKAITVTGTAKRFVIQDWTTGDAPVGTFGSIMIPLPDAPQIDDEISVGDVVVPGFKDLKTALEGIINKTAGCVLVQLSKQSVLFLANAVDCWVVDSKIYLKCYCNAYNSADDSGYELYVVFHIAYDDGSLGDTLTIESYEYVEQ